MLKFKSKKKKRHVYHKEASTTYRIIVLNASAQDWNTDDIVQSKCSLRTHTHTQVDQCMYYL